MADKQVSSVSLTPSICIIHYTITESHPDFSREVLRQATIQEARKGSITASIAPMEEELPSFRIHPMLGNPDHYRSLLIRAGHFLIQPLVNPDIVREIVMYYQIYLDPPVIVTAIEHYLWVCPKEELQRIAAIAGFPVGRNLADVQVAKSYLTPIDKISVIKAIVDSAGIRNCLPETDSSRFLVSIRSPMGNSKWCEQIVQ